MARRFDMTRGSVTLTAGTGTVSEVLRFSTPGARGWVYGFQIVHNNAGQGVSLKISDTNFDGLVLFEIDHVTKQYYAVRDTVYDRNGQVISGVSTALFATTDLKVEITGGTSGGNYRSSNSWWRIPPRLWHRPRLAREALCQ